MIGFLMKSLADLLPPEIAAFVHPDWRKNEADYWAMRDQLLGQYRDVWIGFAGGKVITSGKSPVEVAHAAEKLVPHPFVTCVGREEEQCRIRRAAFPYDTAYAGEALPVISVEFRPTSGGKGLMLDRVIPDTGADACSLPWADCQQIQFDLSKGRPGRIGGVAGWSAPTIWFRIFVAIDGCELPCRLHVDFTGSERILGRYVLNRLEFLFRGPAAEVVVNP